MRQKVEEGHLHRAAGKTAAVVEEGPPFDGVLGTRRGQLDGLPVASAVSARGEMMVDSVLVGPANKPQQDDRIE